MIFSLRLASGSDIRAQMLRNVGMDIDVTPPRIDEDSVKRALIAEGHSPRSIADALAEAKGRKVSQKFGDDMVLAADQVLELEGEILSKPKSPNEAENQLNLLQGKIHLLHSAAVFFQDSKPIWRHVATAKLHMRRLSMPFIMNYVERNWESVQWSVGAYKIEEEGLRLFNRIDGDHSTILGLPMTPLLNFLTDRGDLEL